METKFLTYTKDLTIAPEAGHLFNYSVTYKGDPVLVFARNADEKYATLFAHAPQMLEALEKALRALNEFPDTDTPGGKTYALANEIEGLIRDAKGGLRDVKDREFGTNLLSSTKC